MNIWNKLKNQSAKKMLSLLLVAGSYLGLYGQEAPAKDDFTTNKNDTTKNLPSWSQGLDKAHQSTASDKTANYTDFIDETMMYRYENPLTPIGAKDLIERGPKEYKKYLKAANGDMEEAIDAVINVTNIDENSSTQQIKAAKKIYQDLSEIHIGDMEYFGTFDMVEKDLANKESSLIIDTWNNKTMADDYLPANKITKQLSDVVVLERDSLNINKIDLNNLMASTAQHIGPTGTDEFMEEILENGNLDKKMSDYMPEYYVKRLVKNIVMDPYKGIIPAEDQAKIENNITGRDFLAFLTTRHVLEQQLEQQQEKTQNNTLAFAFLTTETKETKNNKEVKVPMSGVSLYAGMNRNYLALGHDVNMGFAGGQEDNDFISTTGGEAGFKYRLANHEKEMGQGKENVFYAFGKAGIEIGQAHVQYDATEEQIENAAEKYDVSTEYFDDVKPFNQGYVGGNVEAGFAVGPASFSAALNSYHTLKSSDMTPAQRYAMPGNTMTVSYKGSLSLLNVNMKERGSLNLAAFLEFSDRNAWVHDKAPISNNGSSTGTPAQQRVQDMTPEEFKTAYEHGLVTASNGSWNTGGFELTYTTDNNKLDIYANVQASAYNGKGGGGIKPLLKQTVQNITTPDNYVDPSVSFGVNWNFGGRKKETSKTVRQQSTVAGIFDNNQAVIMKKRSEPETSYSETNSDINHIRKRSVFNLQLGK